MSFYNNIKSTVQYQWGDHNASVIEAMWIEVNDTGNVKMPIRVSRFSHQCTNGNEIYTSDP